MGVAQFHTQGKAWYNPTNYDFGISEDAQNIANTVVGAFGGNQAGTKNGGSDLFYDANQAVNQAQTYNNNPLAQSTQQQKLSQKWSNQYANSKTGNPTTKTVVADPTGDNNNNKNPQQNIVSQIDQTYNDTISGLDRMAGLLPGMRDDQLNQIDQSYASQQKGLQSGYDSSNEKIAGYNDQIAVNQGRSIKDLAVNMQSMLQAGNNFLGANKAGNSSAPGMYAYALAQEANKGRAEIMRQANDQYAKTKELAINVKNTYDTNMAGLEQWKANSIGQISNWYSQQLMGIESNKLQAGQDKNNQKLQALQQAMSWMQQLDSQAAQWNQTLQEWFMERSGSINDALAQFGQQSQYDVQNITAPELGGISSIQTQGGMEYNPWALLKKKTASDVNSAFGYNQ